MMPWVNDAGEITAYLVRGLQYDRKANCMGNRRRLEGLPVPVTCIVPEQQPFLPSVFRN